jgi:signal transduction histidine kinase
MNFLDSTPPEALANFLFQFAAEGVLVVNPEGVLLAINPAAQHLLAITEEACLGQPVQQSLKKHPMLLRLLIQRGPTNGDVPLPKGRLATGVAVDLPTGRAVLLHDVTEQRDLESRREALVKTIAHDLRNPLTALSGYATLIGSTGHPLEEGQQKFLLRIQQTTQKLYEMAAKLVDLSWIEAGMPLQFVPVELAHLTRQAIQQLSSEARQKQVIIVNSIPDALPSVMGDPMRLKQTIFNILENAIRYSHQGGTVVIHAWHQGSWVFYAIRDQGLGISEEEVDRVWDRMWRSNDERVRGIPGGGIGLCFAKIIISRHSGQIELSSQLDEGTTVTFRLPVTQ